MVAVIDKQALRQALPTLTGTVSVPGLKAQVEIYRDRWGIPNVRASNLRDAFFAQGFVTAQDRLWQMEYDRRRGAGRWAEVVGETAAEQDVLMRRFRLADSAIIDYEYTKGETRRMFDDYAQGVNAFIGSTDPLPVEYSIAGIDPEPWEPWHGLLVYKVRHVLMGVFESKIWRAQVVKKLGPEKAAMLFPGYQPGHLVILPPGEVSGEVYGEGSAQSLDHGLEELSRGAAALNYLNESDGGSNSWLLAGERTATGKPILAGDSHRGLDTPNVYYQNHLECPEFDVVGLSFAGLPGFPHFGHNRDVAWSVTHTWADYQDLYIERFKPDDPGQYLYRDRWLPAEVHQETIKVKDGEARTIQSWVTQHGPVISGDPAKGTGISFKYTATEGADSGAAAWTDTLLTMLRAGDSHQLVASMEDWVDPCNNFLFADVQGNAGYLCRGRIPIRSMANAWLPVPGWTGDHEWEGYIPFNELPRGINPEQGYVATANNRPVGDDYPYYIALDFTPGFRVRRVTDGLLALDRPSAAEMAAVHREMVSIPAQAYVDFLKDVEPRSPASAEARERLIQWDAKMDAGRVEPTIYSAFRDALLKEVLEINLGADLAKASWNPEGRGLGLFIGRLKARLVEAIGQDDRRWLAPGDTWRDIMSRALAKGVDDLIQRLGANQDDWRWDRLHQARPKHTLSAAYPEMADLLDPPAIPHSGDGDTPLAGSYAAANFATVTGLSVARYAYDLADWENSLWVVPLGSSGHPGSPHYHDQSETWRRVEMATMEYRWDGIIANSETQQVLKPG
jgi:penicillin amidase